MMTSTVKLPTISHKIQFFSLCVWMAEKLNVNVQLLGIPMIENVQIMGIEWEDGSGKNVNVKLSNGKTVFVRVTNVHAGAV